jgi:hypothetical protein
MHLSATDLVIIGVIVGLVLILWVSLWITHRGK